MRTFSLLSICTTLPSCTTTSMDPKRKSLSASATRCRTRSSSPVGLGGVIACVKGGLSVIHAIAVISQMRAILATNKKTKKQKKKKTLEDYFLYIGWALCG